ncbi:DNA-binding protein [Gilvimarinus agarilyticus]|uniref:DNA-binding protein n=1 Tax=Gilvimarinus agarilyticus TaxID=679259 RepID=UPI0012F8F647|nr:DNA-binding protein [Gilvimarinus agarilyticus]
MKKHNLKPLISRRGNSHDNAVARFASKKLLAVLNASAEAQSLRATDSAGVTSLFSGPISALQILVAALRELLDVNTGELATLHAKITTQKGADLFNVSWAISIKLLNGAKILLGFPGNR